MVRMVRTHPEWHLRHIQICPEFQGKGIGTLILKQLLCEAKNASATVVLNVLDVNPSKQLYERLGFRVIEEREKSVKMRWVA